MKSLARFAISLVFLSVLLSPARAYADHQWDHPQGPQVPAPCVASTGSDCQP
jgi:hypothetical protein